jgi:prephenate dehydrogenase
VVIVGVGLLGASLGLALKRGGVLAPGAKVLGMGRTGSPSLPAAMEMGAIDEAFTDLVAAVEAPLEGAVAGDVLIVLCAPVRQFAGQLATLGQVLSPRIGRAGAAAAGMGQRNYLITDVGSTKMQVTQWVREILGPAGLAPLFVGSHPMAGSEKRGPQAARADLFENAVCLICPETAPAESVARIEALWQTLGMRTLRLDAATHDRWVATISHLPRAVAGCLMLTAGEHPEALAAVAGGFIDSTRIAAGDVDMWADIFLTNRDAVVAALDDFAGQLHELRHAIKRGDEAAIRRHLTDAKRLREGLVDPRRPGETHPRRD